jgi:hypothetical protein
MLQWQACDVGRRSLDKNLARIVATAAMRSSSELAGLIPLLKIHDADGCEALGRGIARAIAEIGTEVLRPVFAKFPELEREFNENAQRYGRTS